MSCLLLPQPVHAACDQHAQRCNPVRLASAAHLLHPDADCVLHVQLQRTQWHASLRQRAPIAEGERPCCRWLAAGMKEPHPLCHTGPTDPARSMPPHSCNADSQLHTAGSSPLQGHVGMLAFLCAVSKVAVRTGAEGALGIQGLCCLGLRGRGGPVLPPRLHQVRCAA